MSAAPTTYRKEPIEDHGEPAIVYRQRGYCPVCEAGSEFIARFHWYRDHLVCASCGSIPRERALALTLSRRFPDWRNLAIHESSPVARGVSPKLQLECRGYIATQFFPGEPLGKRIRGFRNENLEIQTFADQSFDLVVTLDVLEHVNQPNEALQEMARTLRPGGSALFTVPTYKERLTTDRRALFGPSGEIEYLGEPEYHGNPVSEAGALVTFHYGYDLPELIHAWSGLDVEVTRFHDHHHGIIGEFTEVYVATKRAGRGRD